jgi:hypothetical protein
MSNTGTNKKSSPPKFWKTSDATNAVEHLKKASGAIGVTFPSLDREHFSIDCPLVEMGRMRPDVVEKLADALDELVALRAKIAEETDE